MESSVDLKVGRHLDVGGDLRVKCNGSVSGDFKVGGWLDAPYVKGILKGLFSSPEKLHRAYPFPREGWVALVGDSLPAPVYRAEGRRWVATGEEGGGPQLPLDSIIERIDKEISDRTSADNALSQRITALETLPSELSEATGRIDILEGLLGLAVEKEEVTVMTGRYFNFRGLNVGDVYQQLQPETTSESGFTAATRSFTSDSRRALVLTARGNDMVRGYVALDENMRVLAMASNEERVFDNTFIVLPTATRHLLMESYGIPLSVTLYGDTLTDAPDTPDPYSRRLDVEIQDGLCYDFGDLGEVGDIFDESRISHVASIPTSQIAIAPWREGYSLKVTMNTGTPNVWGICYIDRDNVIIGREYPFRQSLKARELTPPDGTDRIVFQTYDPDIFPMDITITYSVLDVVDRLEKEGLKSFALPGTLSGKRIVLFGDSISTVRDAAGKRLSDHIADRGGCEVTNCATGGARLSQRRDVSGLTEATDRETALAAFDLVAVARAVAEGDVSLQRSAARLLRSESSAYTEAVSRMETADISSADTVVVLAGTNDYKSGVDHRSESESTGTIHGAVAAIAETICTRYPDVRLIFCTPTPRMENPADPSTFSDTHLGAGAVSSLPEISAAIAAQARLWHLPVIDLQNSLGWNRFNYPAYCSGTDGTHPVLGLGLIAQMVLRSL